MCHIWPHQRQPTNLSNVHKKEKAARKKSFPTLFISNRENWAMSTYSPAVPCRRSPRSIERLCSGLRVPGLTNQQLATLIALAHCTGWSAERINNKYKEYSGIKLTAELTHSLYTTWASYRFPHGEISTDEWDIMRLLMKDVGVLIRGQSRPLSHTSVPECFS